MVSRNCIYSGENYWLKIMKIFLDAVNREVRENTVKEIKLISIKDSQKPSLVNTRFYTNHLVNIYSLLTRKSVLSEILYICSN
jgi:hypothetical protein